MLLIGTRHIITLSLNCFFQAWSSAPQWSWTRKRLGKYAHRTAEHLWEQGEEAIETAATRGKEIFETGKEKAREVVQTAGETVKENILRQTG